MAENLKKQEDFDFLAPATEMMGDILTYGTNVYFKEKWSKRIYVLKKDMRGIWRIVV